MINSCIIGCGNSAQFIDKKNNLSKNYYSHLPILKKDKYFKLNYCADKNNKNLINFCKELKIKKKYLNYKKMLKENKNIEAVIITAPTKIHYEICMEILKYENIKLIICEKPFGYDYKNSLKVLNLIKKKKKTLIINYQRRWDPFYIKIKKIIQKKQLGSLISMISHVDKALYQNSSHMIDLHIFLAGIDIYSKGIIDKKNEPRIVNGIKEYGGHIMIKHKSETISFINASANTMFKKFFEIELNFSDGRIKIENDNDSYLLYKFEKSKNFKKYYELKKIRKYTNNINYQRIHNMYKYARKLIKSNDLKNTYANDSIRVLKIINSFHK